MSRTIRTILFLVLLVGLPTLNACALFGKNSGPELIDPHSVEAGIRMRRKEFAACYDQHLPGPRKAESTMEAVFGIGVSGQVIDARIENSTVKNPEFENCILKIVQSTYFEAPAGRGKIEVRYPFRFAPK